MAAGKKEVKQVLENHYQTNFNQTIKNIKYEKYCNKCKICGYDLRNAFFDNRHFDIAAPLDSC